MFNRSSVRYLSLGLVVAMFCLVLAACGSSGGSSSSSTGETETSSGSGESTSASSEASGGGGVSQAKAMIAPYMKEPTPFPVTEPLKKKLPSSAEFADLQPPTPYAALLAELYGAATKLMGINLGVVKSSESAEGLQAGLSSIQEKEPDGVLLAGTDLSALGQAPKELSESGIPVVTSAIMGTKAQGIDGNVNSEYAVELGGELLGNWAIANGAAEEGVVWFETPEFAFNEFLLNGFHRAMEDNCPECEVTYSKVPISSFGSSAPTLVVSEMQSHPEVGIALFTSFEAATGLPPAMKAAGIEIKTAGYAGTPENLQNIKEGTLTATVALDAAVMAYTQVDMAARLATGQPLSALEKKGQPVLQLVEENNLNSDVSHGYSGYPEFEKKFAELWGSAG